MNVHSLLKPFAFSNPVPTRKLPWLLTMIACLVTALIFSPAAEAKNVAAAKPQVLFLPFDVQIPGSYSYLRNGLASTLASRLATRANVATIAQGSTSEQLAQALNTGNYNAFGQLLQRSGADYLVMGSLAPKAGQFELMGYVFSRTASQAPKQFQQDFQSVDDAMPAIDAMAWEISGKVFNRPRPDALAGTVGGKGMNAFQTAHPERAYREGLMSGSATGLEVGGPFELVSSFRSKGISGEAMDINAGDLDGDGREEILVLSNGSLKLYRNEKGAFRMLATVDLPNHLRYHAVTLGDLNHNGRQEIVLSASNGDHPDATIMEWNGRKITTLVDHAPWYLATVTAPGQAPLLAGQQSLASEVGGGDIFTMELSSTGEVIAGKQLALPKGINIFDFTLADIDGDGVKEILTISSGNRLQVYDANGSLRWTSAELIGASNKFFGTLTSTNNAANSEKDSVWVHTRIVVADLDFDGINDVLVGSNRMETVRFMPNLRYFDGASLSAYQWKNGSMNRLWETKKIPGYITNYQMGQNEAAGNQYRIYFAETESSYPFAFWQSSASYLNCYTLRVNAASKE
ncbi:MAG: VCBS repeat-containing protein [Desulfobulbus sp.]|nr:VCBS repeat-containing protein [Desulfobulbus sp.]